ncbi:MAG: hypothetical protein RIB63_11935 [Fulvivirga sp.]
MQRLIIISVLVLFIFSCTRPEEAPKFRKVGDIKVTKVTGKEALLNANAYFYNPNDVKMTLRKVNIDVILEGKKIGTINQSKRTKIAALSNFTVPLDATFNIGDVGMLKSIMSVLESKKMRAQYKGYIKASVHGIPVRVPIDYEEDIRLR